MGFLGFLSRKQPPAKETDDFEDDLLKAQPYAATTALEPPIRGTVPVAGNGPIVFPKTKQQVYEDYQSPDVPFLPPVNPPYGEDEGERPRTAPLSGWSIHESSTSISAPSAPPAPQAKPPFRLPDKSRPYKLPDQVYLPTHRPTQLFPVVGVSAGKASTAVSRQRAVSTSSFQSARSRAFIDILDAQAGINPTNFHARLRAAGARDYGEDVADRNVGSNGSFLDHQPTGVAKSTSNISAFHTNAAVDEPQSRPKNPKSVGGGRRSRSFTESSRFTNFSHYADAPAPTVSRSRESSRKRESTTVSESTKADRRKSMPSYMDPYSTDGRLEMPEVPLLPWERDETEQDLDLIHYVRDQKNASSIESGKLRPRSNSTKTAPSKRLSSYSMRTPASMMFNDNKSSHTRHESSASDSPDIHQFNFGDLSLVSHQPPSKSKDGRDGFVGDWNKSHSLLSASARFDMDDVIPERSSSLRPGSRGSTSATSASSNPFRPQSRHTANTSIDLPPILSEDANLSRDSLRDVSLLGGRKSSFTFSVDSMQRNPSPPPMISIQRASQSAAFNIDDYISSDEDLDSPRIHTRQDEELLIFNDFGYGMGGFELPGISGLFRPTLGLDTPQKSRAGSWGHQGNMDSAEFLNDLRQGSMNSTFAELRVESRRSHRFHLPTQEFGGGEDRGWMSSEEEEDSEDDISFDIPMTRMDSTLRQYRESRYANREEEIIEEEKEPEKLDVKALMRMRKAANKAKRLSATSVKNLQSRSAKGKEKEVFPVTTIDSAGFETDIE